MLPILIGGAILSALFKNAIDKKAKEISHRNFNPDIELVTSQFRQQPIQI